METEVDKETKQRFAKIESKICYIFISFNVIMIIISFFMFYSKNKNIQKLRNKLILLISTDILSLIFTCIINNNINWFVIEIFYSLFNSIEFYLFFSFIYNIFFITSVSKTAKEVELINLNHLSLCFLLLVFSYNKLTEVYSQLINIIQIVLILCGLLLLSNTIEDIIKTMDGNIMTNDKNNKKVYYYLKFLNKFCLFTLALYSVTKFIYYSIENEWYLLYLEVLLNIISHGLYYFIYIIFAVIIFISNKNNLKNNNDEIVNILQKKNVINNN